MNLRRYAFFIYLVHSRYSAIAGRHIFGSIHISSASFIGRHVSCILLDDLYGVTAYWTSEGCPARASPLACLRLFYVFLVELARLPFLLFELRVRVALYGVLAAVIEAAVFREKAFLVWSEHLAICTALPT